MHYLVYERISHEITCDISNEVKSEISHVKGFYMILQVKFHMWKDFA
jgi:hypothetical protein